jgi:hypothetical protein
MTPDPLRPDLSAPEPRTLRLRLLLLCLLGAILLPVGGALAQSVSIDMGGAGTNPGATARLRTH